MVGHENKSTAQYILQDATSKFLLSVECLDNIIPKHTITRTYIKSRVLRHRPNSSFTFKTSVSVKTMGEYKKT